MKALKITEANAAAIEAALLAVNGKASAHAITAFSEIETIAQSAEAQLESLGIAKGRRAGAFYRKTSGEKMCNAYARKAHLRAATSVMLERRSTGWWLVSASKTDVWQSGGAERLHVTGPQADEAVAAVKAQFSVIA